MKKMLWLLLAVFALGANASAQTSTTAAPPHPPLAVSDVHWNEHPLSISTRNFGSIHRTSNALIVSVTNTGTLPVESVWRQRLTCPARPFDRVGSIESTFGARGLKSARRFEGAWRTKTAVLKCGRFC